MSDHCLPRGENKTKEELINEYIKDDRIKLPQDAYDLIFDILLDTYGYGERGNRDRTIKAMGKISAIIENELNKYEKGDK